MGSWAYGPLDNDAASDWMGDIMHKSKLPNLFEKGLNNHDESKIRAAAFLLERVGYEYMYDTNALNKHLTLAISKLKEMLEDKVWLDSWKDPSEVERRVRSQIRALKKRLTKPSNG